MITILPYLFPIILLALCLLCLGWLLNMTRKR